MALAIDFKMARADYDRDGFVVAADLITSEQIAALRDETIAIATGARGKIIGSDLLSGTGHDILKSILAIHFPHKISPVVRDMLHNPAIVDILTHLIGPDVKAMQSMLFIKNAGKPGQAWHQDEHFIPTRDRSLTGVWIALDDATIDNGCMWMHPGSHKPGIIWPTKPHGDPRFDGSDECYGWDHPYDGGVPAEVSAGSVIFFNGYTLHRSLDNRRKTGFRRALVIHYMNARSMLPWSIDAAHAPVDFRDIEMVAGSDPYAWRGIEDKTFPFVRPEDPAMAGALFRQLQTRSKALEER